MISQAKIKFIHSLESKKGRSKANAFIAEGPKVVGDLLDVMHPLLVVATAEWLSEHGHNGDAVADDGIESVCVADDELRKVSFLQHPQQVLAVFPLPHTDDAQCECLPNGNGLNNLYLALDGVQDPGNLGTIIRVADWFGINDIFCSHDTADAYNPKVIQATMGSIARVRLHYADLRLLFSGLPEGYPVYGTLLDGSNIYTQALSTNGIIVMGNEGNGISEQIRSLINHRLLIPNYPTGSKTTDSLNVAVATAITCAEFRRRCY